MLTAQPKRNDDDNPNRVAPLIHQPLVWTKSIFSFRENLGMATGGGKKKEGGEEGRGATFFSSLGHAQEKNFVHEFSSGQIKA